MGSEYARILANLKGVHFMDACSITEEERNWAANEFGVNVYPTVDEFLENSDCDAVFIASPTDQHVNQIVSCLEAGKHIFCEKTTC